ncbi:hypothetical protein FQN54_005519 [Arachnomyces sp. PD_36]|nr:hypothetical protein FQN54_005519 [Arachnomyces sp. PD_36]
MSYHGIIGTTLTINRVLQVVCLIAIVGMTANFISQMVQSGATPPSVIVGTITVTCIAILYCAITLILFMDNILNFLVNAITDGLHLIAVIVVAVTVGKPLSYLNCNVIGKMSGENASAFAFATSLANNLDKQGGTISYNHWIGASKANCLEMKAIWGLSISLCILFTFSMVSSIFLWKKNRTAPAEKNYEQFDA